MSRLFAILLWALLVPAAARAATNEAALEQGYKLLNAWQLPAARAIGEELIRETPKDPEVLAYVSRLQFYRGEYAAAASLYAGAIEAGAEQDPEYAKVLLDTYRLAKGNLEKESEHFRVSYPPGKDEILADELLLVLEQAYFRVARQLGLEPDPSDKVAVLVVPDAVGLAAASTLTANEIDNSGTIAICKFNRLMITSPLATVRGYDWADTISHEYVHLVINLVSRSRVPIWLHEGIAKFTETSWNGAPGRALSPGSINLLANAAKTDNFIPFEKMHPSMAKLPTQEQSGLAFAEVFVAIKMLQSKRGMDAIKDVLLRIGAGSEVEAAVSTVYGKPFKAFLDDWRAELRTYKGKSIMAAQLTRIELKKQGEKSSDLSELEPMKEKRAQDFARLGELLHMRGRLKAATLEYEKAYQTAGVRYPSLINKYAMALVGIKEEPRAISLLEEMLVPHPDYSPARLSLARALATTGRSADAVTQYRTAMYQNPYIPELWKALVELDGSATAEQKQTYQRNLEITTGKLKPTTTPSVPAGERVSILFAPFGRARTSDGTLVAYPTINQPLPALDVELIARDGRVAAMSAKKSPEGRLEIVGALPAKN